MDQLSGGLDKLVAEGRSMAQPAPEAAVRDEARERPKMHDADPRLLQKDGYLWVRGYPGTNEASERNWHSRFFVVQALQHVPPLLAWFRRDTDREQSEGSPLPLDGAECLLNAHIAAKDKGKFVFAVELRSGALLYLATDSEQERQAWFEVLSNVCQLHRYRAAKYREHGNALRGSEAFIVAREDVQTHAALDDLAQNMTVLGSGVFSAVAGTPTSFSVQTAGELSNCAFEATLENGQALYNLDVRPNFEGTFHCVYTVAAAGEFQLSIKLFGEHHVYGSPFTVHVEPGPTHAQSCMARGEGLESVRAGEVMYFTIVARDALGNDRTEGGDEFQVSLQGPGSLQGVVDNGNGTYSCAYALTLAAQALQQISGLALHISVALGGRHVFGSPFSPKVEQYAQPEVSAAPGEPGPFQRAVHAANGLSLADGSLQLGIPQQPLLRPPELVANSTSNPEVAADLTTRTMAEPNGTGPMQAGPAAVVAASPPAAEDSEVQALSQSQRALEEKQRELAAQMKQLEVLRSQLPASAPPVQSLADRPLQGQEPVEEGSPLPPSLPLPSSPAPAGGGAVTTTLATSDASVEAAALGNLTANLTQSQELASRLASTALQSTPPPRAGPPPDPLRQAPPDALPFLPSQQQQQQQQQPGTHALGSTDDEELWEVIAALCEDPGVQLMFDKHSVQLDEVFEQYAHGPGAGGRQPMVVFGSQAERRGFLRLAMDFDICPSFLSKRDVKLLFGATCRFHGTQGLDPTALMHGLGLLAVQGLSKPSFQHLYPTYQAKVTVLLEMWGLADPIKLQVIRRSGPRR